METSKMFLSGAVLVFLVATVAVSRAPIAGEQETADSAVAGEADDGQEATLPLDATVEESHDPEDSGSMSADIDVSSSHSVDMSLNMSSSFSSSSSDDGEDDNDSDSNEEESSADMSVNGQAISCEPGERYQSPDRSVECRNHNGNVDIDIDSDENTGPFHFNIKFP